MPTGPVPASRGWQNLDAAEAKLMALFREMVDHNGFSELRVEVKLLKKGRKNVVLSSGKDYHFVLKPFGDAPRCCNRDSAVAAQGKPVQKPARTPVEDGNPGN